MICLLSLSVAWAQKSVTVSTAGTLGNQISAAERATITSLKVSGPLNGNDIKVIREMGKAKLAELDLSDATIVKGGDSYYPLEEDKSAYTEDNRLSTLFFYGCGAFRSITIPNSVQSISNDAFSSCPIPNSVQSISNDAFSSCPNLAEIKVKNSPFFLSEDGILFNSEKERLVRCPQAKKLESYEVPRGVIEIYPSAFRGVSTLKSVTLPASIWSISDFSFYGCPLQTIRCNMTRASIGMAFEEGVLNSARVIVPRGSAEDFKSVDGWNKFKTIVEE